MRGFDRPAPLATKRTGRMPGKVRLDWRVRPRRWRSEENLKLVIYMKSGNKITVHGVAKYEINNRGDDIIGMTIEKFWWWQHGSGLLIKTLSLSQIEAVCVA